jgi:hypothetical protein
MGDVRDLVNELRRRGITVHEWSGWDGRGNGSSQIDIRGAVIHHTATNYGNAFQALVSGRSDLQGMLCNFAGNSDGSLTVIGSGLAYHAGGGYGPNQGPLSPFANNRNYYTVGLEIVYPGNSPMTDSQYNTALVFGKAVADLFAGGDLEYVRGHGEVNGKGYEGKWDPGWAPGLMIDMNAFRNDARRISNPKPPVVEPPVEKEKEPMFQTITLEPTAVDELKELLVVLPWQGGNGGVKEVNVNIGAGQNDMRIGIAHWQINTDGKRTVDHAVENGTILGALTDTGGRPAPKNTWALLLVYSAAAGGSLNIEAK